MGRDGKKIIMRVNPVNQSVTTSAIASAGTLRRLSGSWRRPGTVGIVSPGYGTEKVSYGIAPSGFSFYKLYRLPVHRFEMKGSFFKNTPVALDYPVELVHTFNELPIGLRPFVVSFENELPRYLGSANSWQLDFGNRLLESNRCRKILALSEIAASNLVRNLAAAGLSDVSKKVSVFRGAIAEAPNFERHDWASKPQSTPLRVLFVGRDPFGKGLLPVLDALDDCRAHGVDIQATIVCGFETRSYISKNWLLNKDELLNRLCSSTHVTHHFLLPNHEIRRLMQTHDLFLFPTLDESLGWVAVEAAMAAMPVITTDIYALPELVIDGLTGFLIKLRKNAATSRWSGLWLDGAEFEDEVRQTFSDLRQGLKTHILSFADNPNLLAKMGAAARQHVLELYAPDRARSRLECIYRDAIGH